VANVPYQATLIAGLTTPADNHPAVTPDPELGCADGAALGAKLNPRSGISPLDIWVFAQSANGNLLLAEEGYCDRRFRIRSIDPVGNTIKTLAVGAPRWDDNQGALTTFLTPTSLAVAPSGDIYVCDSDVSNGVSIPTPTSRSQPGRGPGIWKLDTHGNISVLAGVSLPMPQPGMSAGIGTDGVGTAASFNRIGMMCHGSDGLLYVNDGYKLRTVSLDGVVTTAIHPPGVNQQTVVACGIHGSVLVFRAFTDSANNDFYDPIARKSIGKASLSMSRGFLLYFGANNSSALFQLNGADSGLAIVNLVDGSAALVAKFSHASMPVDLAATPPVIDKPIAGVATGGMDFDILTGQGVIRFTRKP